MKKIIVIGGLIITGITACANTAPALGSTASMGPGTKYQIAGSTATVAASTPSVNYGQQYLADIGPANVAVKAVPSNAVLTSPSVLALGTATADTARELLAQSWPSNAQADVHALALDAEKVNTDIKAQDETAFLSDAEAMTAQAQVVRADLGLPA